MIVSQIRLPKFNELGLNDDMSGESEAVRVAKMGGSCKDVARDISAELTKAHVVPE